jgi:hypothetical protein
MKKELDKRDIEVRIKFAVIYNDFRSQHPDLYEGLNRITTINPKSLSIFEKNINDKGEEVYFMKFYYNVPERKYSSFKTESYFEDGEVTITKTVPKEIKIKLYKKIKDENLKAIEKIV